MISLEKPQRKWASSRLEGKTSWIFSSCGTCSRLRTGTSGTRSGGLRKGQSTCELLGGLSGFLSLRCRGLRPCVESGLEPEDSSPMLTCIVGYFWSLPRGVSPRLEWGHARALSSRAVAAVSRFPSPGSRDLCLSLEAFPRGFPTGLSQVTLWWESIHRVKVEAVQGKQVPLEWTETSGGLLEWCTTLEFLSPFLWRAPPVEMRPEYPEFFPEQAAKEHSSRSTRRKQGSSGCGRDPRASSRVETGMSGNFLICSKPAKDLLEVPEFSFDWLREASAEMGLISPGGQNLLDFLELRQVLSTYNGDLREPLWCPQ